MPVRHRFCANNLCFGRVQVWAALGAVKVEQATSFLHPNLKFHNVPILSISIMMLVRVFEQC